MPRSVFPLFVVVAAMLSQTPALGHFFRADDILHLYEMQDYSFWRFVLTPHGGHVIPTALGVFYLCRVVFDLNANAYYALAIATHALNAYLLYRIVETSTRRSGLALAAALIWGSSSLNQGSVGWFSVYGHVLAGTWTLLFLYSVARVASGDRPLTRGKPWLWSGYLFGAATSFGTGIPIAMLSGPALYLLLPDSPRRVAAVRTLCSLLVVVPALFILVHWQQSLLLPPAEIPNTALGNKFVWRGVIALGPSAFSNVPAMFEMLMAYGSASLLFGPLLVLSDLATTESRWIEQGFGAVMLFALVYSVWRIDPSKRRRAIGYLLLATGCYGIIALARGTYYYSQFGFTALEAASTARYHYLGPALLAGLLAFAAAESFRGVPKRVLRVAPAAALLFLVANWYASGRSAAVRAPDAGKGFAKTVDKINAKIHAAVPGSRVIIENMPFVGAGWWGANSIPGDATIFLIRFPENEVDGRRVYFSESDPKALAHWKQVGGKRLRDLLIAPPPKKVRQIKRRRGRIGGRRMKRLD